MLSPQNGRTVFDIVPSRGFEEGRRGGNFIRIKKRDGNKQAKLKTPVILGGAYVNEEEPEIIEITEQPKLRRVNSFMGSPRQQIIIAQSPSPTPRFVIQGPPPAQVKRKRRIVLGRVPSGIEKSPGSKRKNGKPKFVIKKKKRIFSATTSITNLPIEEPDKTLQEVYYDHATPSQKQARVFLTGFHPYYDEESDVLALQCSTCCIGCWRNCAYRLTGCENFLSCPIYCWVGCLLPVFFLLVVGLILTALYAAGTIK